MYWPIWIANAILQWGLLALVLRSNDRKRHAAFAVYVAFSCCETTTLMSTAIFAPDPSFTYFMVYWVLRFTSICLELAVLVEVFAAVFRPYSTLPKNIFRGFTLAFVSLVIITAAAAVWFPGREPGDLFNTLLVLDRSIDIIFCGAFAFTAIFSSYFGIPWQHRTFGIGLGFLLTMTVDIVTSSLVAFHGWRIIRLMNAVSMLSFTLALITWLIYFAKPVIPSIAPDLEQLKRLQRALDCNIERAESSSETM